MAEPGGVFTYTLTLTNKSVQRVRITALTDDYPLPAEITGLVGTMMAPGQVITKSYTVSHTEIGVYTNTASVTVKDDDNQTASDCDDACVKVTDAKPAVDIVKGVAPASMAEPGGEFTYTLTITNNSVEDVTITALTDDYPLPAEITALVGTTMTPGQVITKTYTVSHTVIGVYDNTASITVKDNENNPASDCDDARAIVTDAEPVIDIVKDVAPASMAEPGGEFTYTLTITNKSVEDVTITALTDDYPLPADITALIGTTMTPGQVITKTYTVSHTVVGVYDNTASITVKDNENNPASDSDDARATVTDAKPVIEVVKTALPLSLPEPGGIFTYTVTVKNLSVEPVTITALTDTNFGVLPPALAALIGQTIPVGGQVSATYDVAHIESGSYPNRVDVTAIDNEENPASAHDTETVTVTDMLPTIDVVKDVVPSSRPEPGGSFDYTVTVKNLSFEPVTITALTDTNFEVLPPALAALIGQVIPVGGQVSASYSVSHSEAGEYDNTAAVTAVDSEQNPVTDSDTETVEVTDVKPSVDIVKDVAPASMAEPGGDFTYTLTITNTSVEDVRITALTDDYDLPADITALVGTTMTPGQVITKSYTVTHTDAGVYDNTASVTVEDNEENPASDSDDARATVTDVKPDVAVYKSVEPAELPEPGGDFTYTITIRNVGIEPFTITDLTDTNLTEPYPIAVAALIGQIIPVEGELSASYVITRTEAGDYDNTVVVTVADNEGSTDTDSDTESVTITDVLPTVMIDKSVEPTSLAEPGGEFTFTIVVTNTSPEPVDFVLTDTQMPIVATGLELGAFELADMPAGPWTGSLAAAGQEGDSVTFTYTVSHADAGLYDNTASVTVTDNEGNEASASDSEVVEVTDVMPKISVQKSADVEAVIATGGSVTYTVVVTNLSVESVALTSLVDDKFGDLSAEAGLPRTLGPAGAEDASFTFSFTRTISGEAGGDHVNVITATAYDNEENATSAQDSATVEFFLPFTPPDIELSKSADKTVAEPEDVVTYTLTYKNVGEGAAVNFTIVDDFDERYVEVIDAAGGTLSSSTITWAIAGPVAPGAQGSIVYKVRIIKDMPVGTTTVKNVAVAKVPDDANDKNNTAEETVNVTVEESYLPFTGGELTLMLLIAGLAAILGTGLRRMGRESS